MTQPTVGLLHPGAMGSTVGAAARAGGGRVIWASDGRGAETRARAQEAGLTDTGTLRALVEQSAIVLSVCPPSAALDLARAVAALGFRGTFVDGNAVSPASARAIGAIVERAGARYVDGGIVGPPALRPGTTRFYLSGPEAGAVAALFEGSALEAIVLDGPAGAASALKMAYAAWTKGTTALVAAIRALAVAEGVDGALLAEWKRSLPDLPARSESGVATSAPKAWRFVGEMEEIAATFEAAGLPGGFHQAAADVYQRMTRYKDTTTPPSAEEVAKVLLAARTTSG